MKLVLRVALLPVVIIMFVATWMLGLLVNILEEMWAVSGEFVDGIIKGDNNEG